MVTSRISCPSSTRTMSMAPMLPFGFGDGCGQAGEAATVVAEGNADGEGITGAIIWHGAARR